MDIKKKFRRGQIDISLEQVSSVKTNVPETHVAELFCNEACAESHNTCRDTQRWLSLSHSSLSWGCVSHHTCFVPQATAVLLSSLSEATAIPISLTTSPATDSRYTAESPLSSFVPLGQLSLRQQQGGDAMLGVMMWEVLAGDGRSALRRGSRQPQNHASHVHERGCQICKDDNHTTVVLCFTCFKPGQTRCSCPRRTSAHVQGN